MSMPAPQHDAGQISRLLAGNVTRLVSEILPHGTRIGQEWRVGGVDGSPGESAAVHLGGGKAGIWADFATGEKGDALDLVAAVLFAGDKKAACDWSRRWLGLAGAEPATRGSYGSLATPAEAAPALQRLPARQDTDFIKKLLNDIVPGHNAVAIYLRSRGFSDQPANLSWGFVANARHPSGSRLDALFAPFVDQDANLTGLHRTYLREDWCGKADVQPQRATVGVFMGSAVRLFSMAPHLVIGEGLESSLAAAEILKLPAWAAGSAGNLATGVRLPDGVRQVTIAADNDEAGREAADKAARRWKAEGRAVKIALPDEPGEDFNDILRRRRGADV